MNSVLGLPIYTGSIRVQDSATGLNVNTPLTSDTITPIGQNGARGHKTWTDTSRWPWKTWTLTWETADNGTVGDTVAVTLTGAYQLAAAGTVAQGNVTLTRNALGNIASITGTPKIAATETRLDTTFDPTGQATATTSGTQTVTYTHDGAGRLTTENRPTGTLTTSYDARGLPTGRTAPGITETRTYDAFGDLVTVSDGVSAESVLWDRLQNIPQPAVTTTGTGPGANHLYGNGRVATVETGGANLTVPEHDWQGSTTGPAGLARAAGYDAWGLPADTTLTNAVFGIPTPAAAPTWGYRGELTLGDTQYLRARWYTPARGTFTSQDPVDGITGTATETNEYAYTANDPVNLTDPTGRDPYDDGMFMEVGSPKWWETQEKTGIYGARRGEVWVRGNIHPSCLLTGSVCPSTGGSGDPGPERQAQAKVIRALGYKNHDQDLFDSGYLASNPGGYQVIPAGGPQGDRNTVFPNIDWEVRPAKVSRPGVQRIDVVYDQRQMLEVKDYDRRATVDGQLARYETMATSKWGLAFSRGSRLNGWSVTYEYRGQSWVAWGDHDGHVYFSKWDDRTRERLPQWVRAAVEKGESDYDTGKNPMYGSGEKDFQPPNSGGQVIPFPGIPSFPTPGPFPVTQPSPPFLPIPA